MKKVFLFLLATSAVLSSCGSDDGGSGSKKPASITLEGGGDLFTYTMTYDSKSRLSTMSTNYAGPHTFTFSYTDSGKVSNVAATGSNADGVAFTYDSQNRLATVTRTGDAPMTVTWTDSRTLSIDGSIIKLDEKGDFALFEDGTYTRDSGKGAFANVKGVDALTMAFVEYESIFFASKRPVKSIVTSGYSYHMSNTFEGGMLTGEAFNLQGTDVNITIGY